MPADLVAPLKKLPLPYSILSSRGSYVLQSILAYGSGGYVFKSHDNSAIKIVPFEELSADELFILTNIHHPNLIHAFDHGIVRLPLSVAQYYYFFALPLAPHTMQNISIKDVSFAQKIHWIQDLYCGLRFLHEHSYVHGDIHPKNVLINSRNQAQFTDFNLSYNVADYKTATSQICTPPFCSPLSLVNNEWVKDPLQAQAIQLHCDENIKRRLHDKCDLFAFGQLMTWILFSGDSFLMGSGGIDDIDSYVCNMIQFVSDEQQTLVTYLQQTIVKHHLHEQLLSYGMYNHSTQCTVQSIVEIMYKTLRVKQHDRMSIYELDCILSW